MIRHSTRRDQTTMAAENRRQMGRFLLIGGMSVATDFGCYLLLAGPLGVATNSAKGLSYVVGMVVGFFGNKYWTFVSARRSIAEPVAYAMLYAVTLAVNIGVNAAVLSALGPSFKLPAFLLGTGTTTVLNFLGMRLVAFRSGIAERLDSDSKRVPSALPVAPQPHAPRSASQTHKLVRG